MTGGDAPVPDHIANWAHEPGPSRVLADAIARFERGQALMGGTCRVELSQQERHQVGRLLPAAWAASAEHISWRDLRAGLAANETTLEAVVASRMGPWRNERQEQRDMRHLGEQDHARAVRALRAALCLRAGLEVPDAAVEVLRRGLFGRRTTTADAVRIQQALDSLPAAGATVGLAVLAARVFGDAHALDRATPLGRAVARFLRLATLLRAGQPTSDATAGPTPQGWRIIWAEVGVVCDQVSSQVLVLNLPLVGRARAVAIATAAAGEPVWLTLRSMTGGMSLREDVPTVFVCENPSIVEAAADALGAASPPLVCTFGRPSAAALQLLGSVGSDTAVRVQADADPAGRAIVDALLRDHPTAVPWRMPEVGVVYEEELVDVLLADLREAHVRAP